MSFWNTGVCFVNLVIKLICIFKSLFTDKTGKISLDNLRNACREHGLKLSDQELKDMIQEADLDGDGKVNAAEFVQVMKKTNLFS